MNTLFPSHTKGIIFDLDGTLYSMKWFMKPLFSLLLFPHSLLLGQYMSLRKEFSGKDFNTGDNLIQAMAERLSHYSKKRNTKKLKSWISNDFYSVFIKVMPFFKGSRPGAAETLLELKKKGYKLAVLSDFAVIKERLIALDINPSLFDTLLSTESQGALKPCARPFLEIANTWKIDPNHLVVVGDKDETDGIGASQSGMAFVKIADSKKQKNGYHWYAINENLKRLDTVK